MLYLTDDFGRAVASTTVSQIEHVADALLASKADVIAIDAADPDLCYYDSAVDGRWANQPMDALFEAGHDPYGIIVDRIRKAGTTIMAGMRMNDHHGDENMWTAWARAHSHWSLGKDTGDRRWRAVGDLRQMDYAIEGVREHRLAIIAEILDRYPVDGLQLDFGRSVPFLSDDKRAKAHLLTQYLRDVRKLLDDTAERTGRKMTVGALLPWDLPFCRSEGLEVDVWVREGLVSYVAPGEWYYSDWNMPLADWTQLVEGTPCTLVPFMMGNVAPDGDYKNEDRQVTGDHRLLDGPKIRALAETCYHQGAHDLMLYNYYGDRFTADYPHVQSWIDRDKLTRHTRQYFFGHKFGYDATENYTFHSNEAFDRDPLRKVGDKVAYDFRFSAPADDSDRLLRFKLLHFADRDRVAVTLNGEMIEADQMRPAKVKLADAAPAVVTDWSRSVDMPPLVQGMNHLEVTLAEVSAKRKVPIGVGELEVFVTPRG